MPKASGPTKVELPFPFKGVSGDSAFGRVPEGMSPDALNVMGFDALGGRLRGGQRPGLSRYWTDQIGSGAPVQSLLQGTTAVAAGTIQGSTLTDPFTYISGTTTPLPDGFFDTVSTTDWGHYRGQTATTPMTNSAATAPAAWATGTAYLRGGRVLVGGQRYRCLTNHTSTNSGTDLHPTPPGNTTDWQLGETGALVTSNAIQSVDIAGWLTSAFYLPGKIYSLPGTSLVSVNVKTPAPTGTASIVYNVHLYCRVNPLMTGECYGVTITLTVSGPNHATPASRSKAIIVASAFKWTTTTGASVSTIIAGPGTATAALYNALTGTGAVLGLETYGTPIATTRIEDAATPIAVLTSTDTYTVTCASAAAAAVLTAAFTTGVTFLAAGFTNAGNNGEMTVKTPGAATVGSTCVIPVTANLTDEADAPSAAVIQKLTHPTHDDLALVGDSAYIAGGRITKTDVMTDVAYDLWTRVGFGLVQTAASGPEGRITVDDFTLTGVDYGLGAASYKTVLTAVAGGTVYLSDAGDYTPTVATNGTAALSTSQQWVGATLSHGSTPATSADTTAGIAGHQMVYYVDGTLYKRLDLVTSTVLPWTADPAAGGAMPISGSDTATIIATYRNRVALSGLSGDPQNWFLSAVGDPRDWNYSPATTTATMAVAGNNSNAGIVGDVVTCLAPYSDDVMVMGGDHTIWVMRGDPAARGQIDNVSRKTGISGPRAFAWDDRGNIHFFGSGRHWIMSAGSASPTAQSAGRMDREWGALDLSETITGSRVQLVWDVLRKGLHIYVSPIDSALAAKHWFWDSRTDAYWPIQYPNAMNPRSVLAFDATKADDTATLIGGSDGYVRYFNPAVKNDDGTAIDSWVVFRPVSNGSTDLRVTHADIVLDDNTDFATFQVFSAETPQTATALGGLRFAKVLGPGRTHVIGRAADNTLAILLRNNTVSQTWAYESGELQLSPAGHTMQGARST